MKSQFAAFVLFVSCFECSFRIKEKQFAVADLESDEQKLNAIFEEFLRSYDKYYFHPNEAQDRKQIFQKNFKRLSKKRGTKQNFQLSLNKFSDLTWEEFESIYLMKNNARKEIKRYKEKNQDSLIKFNSLKSKNYFKFEKEEIVFDLKDDISFSDKSKKNMSNSFIEWIKEKFGSHNNRILTRSSKSRRKQERKRVRKLKRSVDWSQYATVVQEQKKCSSCYAFAAMAAYETLYSITHKKQLNFSEQEIIDCSPENQGCTGGNPFLVFDYINRNGISSESQYPYTGERGECQNIRSSKKLKAKIKYFFCDENIFDLLEALGEGPVATVMHVNENFKNYSSGIFDDPNCEGELNHSVLAISYDLDTPIPYIKFKNAWAEDWGDQGFFKLAIGPLTFKNKGICLIANHDLNVAPYF
jgi:KDEL-tailed cysteine endopeptidase